MVRQLAHTVSGDVVSVRHDSCKYARNAPDTHGLHWRSKQRQARAYMDTQCWYQGAAALMHHTLPTDCWDGPNTAMLRTLTAYYENARPQSEPPTHVQCYQAMQAWCRAGRKKKADMPDKGTVMMPPPTEFCIRPRPHSPRTPTEQDYKGSPRPTTATSPHDPITPTHAHSSVQDRGPAQGQWWRRWTHTQLWELRKWVRTEPSLESLVHRPRKGSVENSHLQPAGGRMPQAAWEAMLANALHPLGVQPRNLSAPQDHPYVLKRLRETLQEMQRDGIRLRDITQSPTPHTHTPSPHHKCRRTEAGGTHSTPGAQRATQHDAPDPPASGAAT